MTHIAKTNGRRFTAAAVLILSGLALVGGAGCDEYLLTAGGLVDYANIASWGGLVDPWYTSSMGLPAFPGSLYDPTSTIQDVIGYRLDAMDNAAAGWSDYILQ